MRSCAYTEEESLFFKELEMAASAQDIHRTSQGHSAQAFTDAMSRAVTGVNIVTTNGAKGQFGLTVSSMTSVSANPPMLLVCVNRSSIAHDAIRDNERFAINVLTADQHEIASQFAGRSNAGGRYLFDHAVWDISAALPRLRGAAAYFECSLVSAMTFGSHSIFVARVTDSDSGDHAPLLYTGRDYGRPTELF